MLRFALATMSFLLIGLTSGNAQVSDDISVDVEVTAQPQISITIPGADVLFTSDGATVSPGSITSGICFATNLSDVRVTVAKLNGINNGLPSLISKDVNDFFNYNLDGVVFGVGGSLQFNTTDSRDYDLTSATTGQSGCPANDYRFSFTVGPIDAPVGSLRSIQEVVADNGLDDGTTYVFTDVLTITFEPVL